MFCIEEGKIKLTKGDTAVIEVILQTDDGQVYNMQEGDTLTLNIAENYGGSKTVQTSTNNIITLAPSKTSGLQFEKGVYSIVLVTDGNTFTVASDEIILFERV